MENNNCQRCGYCCITSLIIVVSSKYSHLDEINLEEDIPDDMIVDVDNRQTFCPHLYWDDEINRAGCSIHHKKWFKHTPCYQYCNDNKCNIGKYIVDKSLDRYKKLIKEISIK